MKPLRLHVISDVPPRDTLVAAASRIHGLAVVDSAAEADAIVAYQDQDEWPKDLPVLQLGELSVNPPKNVYPALPNRFDPHVQAVRRRLDAGDLGKPGLVRLYVWNAANDTVCQRKKTDAIDLVLWLVGEEVESSYGTQTQTTQVVHLGFASGAMALIDFYDHLPAGDRYRSLTVIGSEGAAYADDHRDRNLFFANGGMKAQPPATDHAGLAPMLEDFASHINSGRDANHAQQAYRAAEAIVKQRLS